MTANPAFETFRDSVEPDPAAKWELPKRNKRNMLACTAANFLMIHILLYENMNHKQIKQINITVKA